MAVFGMGSLTGISNDSPWSVSIFNYGRTVIVTGRPAINYANLNTFPERELERRDTNDSGRSDSERSRGSLTS